MIKVRNEELLKKFGINLKRLRMDHNLSQQALANESNIEKSQIVRIEQGKINPTLSTIMAIKEALNEDIGRLFDFTKEPIE